MLVPLSCMLVPQRTRAQRAGAEVPMTFPPETATSWLLVPGALVFTPSVCHSSCEEFGPSTA